MAQIVLVIPDNASTHESTENDLDIITVQPCNPQFATEASRIESYKKKWPSHLAQTPNELSSAGFFFAGT